MMQDRGVVRRLFLRGSLKHSPHAPNERFLMFHRRQKHKQRLTPSDAPLTQQPLADPPLTTERHHTVHASSRWYRRVLDADPRMQRALSAPSPPPSPQTTLTAVPPPVALLHVLGTLPWQAALELFTARCATERPPARSAVLDPHVLQAVSALLRNPNQHCPPKVLLQALVPSLHHGFHVAAASVDGSTHGPYHRAWLDATAALLQRTMGHDPSGILNAWRTCCPASMMRSPRTAAAVLIGVPPAVHDGPPHASTTVTSVGALLLARIEAAWSQWSSTEQSQGLNTSHDQHSAWRSLCREVWADLARAVHVQLRNQPHATDDTHALRCLLVERHNGQVAAHGHDDSAPSPLARVTAMMLDGMRSSLRRPRLVALWLLFLHHTAASDDGSRLHAVHAALTSCRSDVTSIAEVVAWGVLADVASSHVLLSRSSAAPSINSGGGAVVLADALVQLCHLLPPTSLASQPQCLAVHDAFVRGLSVAIDALERDALLLLAREASQAIAHQRQAALSHIDHDAARCVWAVVVFVVDVELKHGIRHPALLGLREHLLRAAFPVSMFGGRVGPLPADMPSLLNEHRLRVALHGYQAMQRYAKSLATLSTTTSIVHLQGLLASWSVVPTLPDVAPPGLVIGLLLTQEPSLWRDIVSRWSSRSVECGAAEAEVSSSSSRSATPPHEGVDQSLLQGVAPHLVSRLWLTLLRHGASTLATWLFDQSAAGNVPPSPSILVDAVVREVAAQSSGPQRNHGPVDVLSALALLVPRGAPVEAMSATTPHISTQTTGQRVVKELCRSVALFEAAHRHATTGPPQHRLFAPCSVTAKVIAVLAARCQAQPWRVALSLLAHCTDEHIPPSASLFQSALTSLSGGTADDFGWRIDIGIISATPHRSGGGGHGLKDSRMMYACNVRGLHHDDVPSAVPRPCAVAPSLWQHAVGVVQQLMSSRGMRPGDRRFLLRSASQAVVDAAWEGGGSSVVTSNLVHRLAADHGVYTNIEGVGTGSGRTPPPPCTALMPNSASASALQALLLTPHNAPSGVAWWSRAVALVGAMDAASMEAMASNPAQASSVGEALRRTSTDSWYGASCLLSVMIGYNTTAASPTPPSDAPVSPVIPVRRPLTASRSTVQICFSQFAKSGAWQQALELAAALRCTEQPPLSPHAMWPSSTAYGSCLSAARHARRWDVALRVFDALHRDAVQSELDPATTRSTTSLLPGQGNRYPGTVANAHPRPPPPPVEITFAHIAEFVATLMDPLGAAPIHAVQLAIERCTAGTNVATGGTAHMRALVTLLRAATTSSNQRGLVPSQGANCSSAAALEVYLSLLDATTTADARRGVWMRAMEAFCSSIATLLPTAAAATPGEENLVHDDGDVATSHVPSARSVLSLLSILRRERQWLAALGVYALSLRLLGTSATAAHQLRQWDTKLTYTTLATIAEHGAAWRSALAIFRRHAARLAAQLPQLRHRMQHAGGQAVDHRVLDRATHAILAHAPAQWAVALSVIERHGGGHPTRNDVNRRVDVVVPPPHALELIVCASEIPLAIRTASFQQLVRVGALPVALTHHAALNVISLVEDMLSTTHGSVERSSSGPPALSPLAVLHKGIRNLGMRVKNVEDVTVLKPMPLAVRLRFLRVYYESKVFALWTAAVQQRTTSAVIDVDNAHHVVDRLLEVYRQQAAAVVVGTSRNSETQCNAPSISAAQLERVGVVLDRVLGDAARAAAIRNWLDEGPR